MILSPIFIRVGWTFGFAASSALRLMPWAFAIFPSVSPATTVYSVVVDSTGGGTMTGRFVGMTAMVFDAFIGGKFVSTAMAFVSTGGLFSASVFSRLQPWMSIAVRPQTPKASTQKTASFMRERRLSCSSSEPWGTNGFGLFMGLARVASFLRGRFFCFDFSTAKFSLEKFRGGLNLFYSPATERSRGLPLPAK